MRSEIEAAMKAAGLRTDLGKGWTPIDIGVKALMEKQREEREEEECE